ncbi:MAG TPA: hypothetical protein VLH79_01560 [Chthonomonadales bacterium]|nr:hypothetical protein [Chthonomonadales bacterium]
MCVQCTRREFLEVGVVAGGVVGGVMLAGAAGTPAWAADTPPRPLTKSRICVIFAGPAGPEDRGWNADTRQKEAMRARLVKAQADLGNVELLIGESHNHEQTAALLRQAGPDTPVLAINLNMFALMGVVQPILDANHPMVVFSLPASGHDWMYPHRWQRRGHPVTLLPTGSYDELERAIRLLRVIPMMRQTRILLFPPVRGTAAAQSPEEVKRRLGADVVAIDERTFDAQIPAADDEAVRAEAARWTREARGNIEPTEEAISKAARVSVGLQRLMRQHQAQGLAIGTCMGWADKGFPCLSFARLRDAGLPAACEGDMDSLLTMLMLQYALDRPGFQGNATFDTSRNALWTAHCTGPLLMDGRSGRQAPYLLRGHSEVGGAGCVLEAQYRLNEIVTRTKLVNLDTILASTGRIIEVPRKSVRACRTQIVTRVRDAATMAVNWSSILETEDAMTLLHRVVVYGDQMDNLRHLARLMDLKVVEEG